jgi:hypothetical protein
MKTKMIILLGMVIIVAGSLISFTSIDSRNNEIKSKVSTQQVSEPAGGFVSEDKL